MRGKGADQVAQLHPSVDSMSLLRPALSPTRPHISMSTLRVRLRGSVSLPISTIFTESTPVSGSSLRIVTCDTIRTDGYISDTPLEESIGALDKLRREGKTKYIGLSECSADTLEKANASTSSPWKLDPLDTKVFPVAKIDAIQAEYSAFETVHETNGLIDTAKRLGVAFVAFSPLGHGWLVDDFKYKSPDEFAADDFRRTGECR